MRMLNDGEGVEAADGRVDEIRDKASGELTQTAPHRGATTTLLAMTAHKPLLMSGVFPA